MEGNENKVKENLPPLKNRILSGVGKDQIRDSHKNSAETLPKISNIIDINKENIKYDKVDSSTQHSDDHKSESNENINQKSENSQRNQKINPIQTNISMNITETKHENEEDSGNIQMDENEDVSSEDNSYISPTIKEKLIEGLSINQKREQEIENQIMSEKSESQENIVSNSSSTRELSQKSSENSPKSEKSISKQNLQKTSQKNSRNSSKESLQLDENCNECDNQENSKEEITKSAHSSSGSKRNSSEEDTPRSSNPSIHPSPKSTASSSKSNTPTNSTERLLGPEVKENISSQSSSNHSKESSPREHVENNYNNSNNVDSEEQPKDNSNSHIKSINSYENISHHLHLTSQINEMSKSLDYIKNQEPVSKSSENKSPESQTDQKIDESQKSQLSSSQKESPKYNEFQGNDNGKSYSSSSSSARSKDSSSKENSARNKNKSLSSSSSSLIDDEKKQSKKQTKQQNEHRISKKHMSKPPSHGNSPQPELGESAFVPSFDATWMYCSHDTPRSESSVKEFEQKNVLPPAFERAQVAQYLQRQKMNAVMDKNYEKADKLFKINSKFAKACVDADHQDSQQVQLATINLRINEITYNLQKKQENFKEKVEDFKYSMIEKRENMKRQHKRELDEFDEYWSSEDALRKYSNPSPYLLELNQKEQNLVKIKEYQEAITVRSQAKSLEERETAEAQKKAERDVYTKKAALIKRQNEELKKIDEYEERMLNAMKVKEQRDEASYHMRISKLTTDRDKGNFREPLPSTVKNTPTLVQMPLALTTPRTRKKYVTFKNTTTAPKLTLKPIRARPKTSIERVRLTF